MKARHLDLAFLRIVLPGGVMCFIRRLAGSLPVCAAHWCFSARSAGSETSTSAHVRWRPSGIRCALFCGPRRAPFFFSCGGMIYASPSFMDSDKKAVRCASSEDWRRNTPSLKTRATASSDQMVWRRWADMHDECWSGAGRAY